MPESRYPESPILLVDDEPDITTAAQIALAVGGLSNVVVCNDARSVPRIVAGGTWSMIVLDLIMPGERGDHLLPSIQTLAPETPIVVATGVDDVETAVALMRGGAFDYLVKPVDARRLVATVRRAVEHYDVQCENRALRDHLLRDELENASAFEHIVTRSERMRKLFRYVEAISPTALPVLITGETGVGKELLAEAVHRASGRAGEFVAVNTAGLDDQLFSDTLFGHVKGAFTGATADRRGVVASATGGTLFLDEIGDLSPESQIKLLRLIQQREYYPLGSDRIVKTDARFVFATNHDLERAAERGAFRHDLFYRLRSHQVVVPALRDRPGDIALLARLFVDRAIEETGLPVPANTDALIASLRRYDFPGNVRELQGLIYDAVVRSSGGVLGEAPAGDGFDFAGVEENIDEPIAETLASIPRLPELKACTDALIAEALRRSNGNQTTAAALLGMTRAALNKRLVRSAGSETNVARDTDD